MVLNQNQYISRIDITETNEPQKDVKGAFSEAGHNPLTGTKDETAQSEQANDNELNEPQQFYSETKEAEPYPINALPNSLKGVIDYLEASVECDISMITPMIFSVLSVTFQHHYTVSFKIGTKYFNDISLSLAIILIALSSERKTSLEKDAFKPLKDYERNIINEITKKINEAKTKLSDWNEKDKALKGVITGIEKKLLIEFDDNKADTLQKQLNTAKERYTKFLEAV